MSHNYPYQHPLSDSNFRPNPPSYSSAADSSFYKEPQESFSSSYLSSSSSSSSFSASRSSVRLQPAQNSRDSVRGILSSCGLQPKDLALLAKMPEDALTIESLPHILQQIKDERGIGTPFPPTSSSSSYSSSSAHQTSTSFSSRDWDQLSNHPAQYHRQSTTTSSEPLLDRWGNPMTIGSVRSTPSSSSSSSRHLVDYDHRPRPPDYGKTGPVPSCSPAGPATRAPAPHISDSGRTDYRTPPALNKNWSSPWEALGESGPSASSSYSSRASDSAPSRKQALDFHGMSPQVFPYSCSLCDITVLSERVWIQHINGTIHADGQLVLLQQFPNWDCRMDTDSRNDNQSDRQKKTDRPAPPAPKARTSEKRALPPNKKAQKTSEKGKVVCAKFPAQSVDEVFLRKLVEPFGKLIKILMFPSLAFVELGSADQANDLVKFHSNYPPTVKGEKIEFSISNAFNFLQSSQVLSFTPAPTGQDGRSDLMSIIKRFGMPVYTLFLPSKAFVEMRSTADAQKLVDYYSSNTLRINKDRVTVAFSAEYKTLAQVPSSKKYEEEPVSTQRTSSRDHKTRTRSRSRDKSKREKRSRSRDKSREKKETRRKTRAKSRSRERLDGAQKSRTRSRSRDISSREKSTRTRDKSSNSSSKQNRSAEKLEDPKKPAAKTSTADEPHRGDREAEAADEDRRKDDDDLSAEESDIEGMEVIAEDGENIVDEEEEEEAAGEVNLSREEEDEQKNVKTDDQEKPRMEKEEEMERTQEDEEMKTTKQNEESEENEEEPGFPLDLENCITLDEVETDDQDDDDADEESESSRVLYFSAMPLRFTDAEFLKLMKGFGTVVRYLLIRNRRQCFVEMSSQSEAMKAARQLDSKSVSIGGCRLHGTLSRKYNRLINGWDVRQDKKKRSEQRGSKRSSRTSTSDTEETSRRSKGRKEASRMNQEKSDKSPEMDTSSKKTEETDVTNNSETRKHPDRKTTRSPEKRKGGSDNTPVPQKSRRTEPEEKKTEDPKPSDSEKDSTSPDPPQQVERQTEPAEDVAEPKLPAEPVGAEFVRPVVGYFCNLCQLIFCDEDEAKVGHCSTLEHYRKYQEKTGNNPWAI
ncbi:matrin 3-like 1.1 isoform X2 [Melanotaenia boesemani]|uniref:matrin 3-like 1.1 isoform X2 n=1 Tax=Melanotaenia boesemani TaxID=1250792 RepID=UPI001C0498D5|nr:matrin 3-like 1.1 isoform X2 [Melanotaenia boesemani]